MNIYCSYRDYEFVWIMGSGYWFGEQCFDTREQCENAIDQYIETKSKQQ